MANTRSNKKKPLSRTAGLLISLLVCAVVAGAVYWLVLPAFSEPTVINLSNVAAFPKSSDGQGHSLTSNISVQ
ncbi:MAG: hypothetical protein LBU77_04305, partial [Clostridiales bacterium]|nr:hypothetical protein [Clostridiales bacterium]